MLNKILNSFIEDAKKDTSFWAEDVKLQFAVSLEKQRKRANMSYKAVADSIGKSAAYVSKVFRGDSNVTIETMVELAQATGGFIEIKVTSEPKSNFDWAEEVLERNFKHQIFQHQSNNTVIYIENFKPNCQNNANYQEKELAAA